MAGPAQDVGQVGAVAQQPALALRDGRAHPVRAGVAGEHRAQGHDHLLGGGQHLPLAGGGPRDPQRQQRGAEPVVGQRGPGDADGPAGQPGGLHRAPAGVAQGGGEQDLPVLREPFAGDPQGGFGLDGEVEPDRTGGAVDRAAEAEAAPPLRVGDGPFGDPGDGVGEGLLEGGARAQPGQGLVGGQHLGLAAAARPGEEGDGPDREGRAAVPSEGGQPQFGDHGARVPLRGPGGTGGAARRRLRGHDGVGVRGGRSPGRGGIRCRGDLFARRSGRSDQRRALRRSRGRTRGQRRRRTGARGARESRARAGEHRRRTVAHGGDRSCGGGRSAGRRGQVLGGGRTFGHGRGRRRRHGPGRGHGRGPVRPRCGGGTVGRSGLGGIGTGVA